MGYHVINKEGQIIGFVETEAEAQDLLENVPKDLHVFFLGGSREDVERFMLQLNGGMGVTPTFFEMLADKYGKIPDTINPFQEIRSDYFRHSATFVKLRRSVLSSDVAKQLMAVLNRTTPAGAAYFLLIEKPEVDEGMSVDSSGEELTIFYVPDVPDEVYDGAAETVLASPVL